MALDRDFILQHLWFGIGKAATGPVSSTTRFYDPAAKLPAFDVAAANKLLDEAGLKPNAQGVRASFKHLIPAVWRGLEPHGRVFPPGHAQDRHRGDAGNHRRRRLGVAHRQLGLRDHHRTCCTSTATRRWASSGQLRLQQHPEDPVHQHRAATPIRRSTRCSPPRGRAPAPTERQKAFDDVQALLVEEMPQIWMMELAYPTITDKRLHNVIQLGTGDHASFDDVFLSA